MTAETNRCQADPGKAASAPPRRTPPPRTATPAPSADRVQAVRLAHALLLPFMSPTGQGPGHSAQYKRNDGSVIWRVDYQDAGGTRRRVGQYQTRSEAEAARRHIIRQRDLEKLGMPTGRDIALGTLADRYARDLATKGRSPEHVRGTRSALRQLEEHFGADRGVATLTLADLAEYQGAVVQDGRANRTANKHTAALHAAIRWGKKLDLIDRDPLTGLDKLPNGKRQQKVRRRALSDSEIGRLMRALRELDALAPKYASIPQTPLFHTMLVLGLRVGEAYLLQWRDVRLLSSPGALTVRPETCKTGRGRTLEVPPGLADDLRALGRIQARRRSRGSVDPGWRVFWTPRGLNWKTSYTGHSLLYLKRALGRAGIPLIDSQGRKVDQHALRHTAGTRLARQGATPAKVQKVLGHSTIAMTMEIYTHLEDADLRGTISDLGGAS